MTASLPRNSGSWIADRLKKWTTPSDDITEEPKALSADKGVAALVESIPDEPIEELSALDGATSTIWAFTQWLKEDQEEGDNR